MKFLVALVLALVSSTVVANVRFVLNPPTAVQKQGIAPAVELLVFNDGSDTEKFSPAPSIDGRLQSIGRSWNVQLRAESPTEVEIAPHEFVSMTYTLAVPADVTGLLALEVDNPFTAHALIEIRDLSNATEEGSIGRDEPPATSQMERAFVNRFGFHEPIYFIYGPEKPAVKFQFSFKYRLTGGDSTFGTGTPSPHGLYFAFTQRSLWDTAAASSPFFDTSYMPELFYEWLAPTKSNSHSWFHWGGAQGGFQHESNGKDGPDSRSLNILYLRPFVVLGALDSWNLMIAPRVFSYYNVGRENPDIDHYRGHGDVRLVFGKNDGLRIGVNANTGKGNFQIDVTHPVRIPVINLQTYLLLQYFDGYGESLRTYNQKSSLWRAGVSFVR